MILTKYFCNVHNEEELVCPDEVIMIHKGKKYSRKEFTKWLHEKHKVV